MQRMNPKGNKKDMIKVQLNLYKSQKCTCWNRTVYLPDPLCWPQIYWMFRGL